MPDTTTRDGGPKHEQLAAALSEALRMTAASRTGNPWHSRAALLNPHSPTPSARQGLVVSLQLTGQFSGELLFSVDGEFLKQLSPPTEDGAAETPADVWLRFVDITAEQLGPALLSLFGDLEIQNGRAAALPQDAGAFASIELSHEDKKKGNIFVLTNAELRSGLERLAPGTQASAELLPVGEGTHLNRVIDVPLAVTLRFGQRQLTLRELLALSTGSLVELDRQVEEPVDLMLGERIVARGEVVIVDGNYGMRVTQVVEDTHARRSHIPR